MLKRLPSSSECEQSRQLADSVDVLVSQHADTVTQVSARQAAVDERLRQWTLFDDNYQKLLTDVLALHTSTDDTKTLTPQQAISKIENVSTTRRLTDASNQYLLSAHCHNIHCR